MQKYVIVCDMCNSEEGVETVDLSWIQDGYEADLCNIHRAQIIKHREELVEVWLANARRAVPSMADRKRSGANNKRRSPTFGTPEGVEGVDWRQTEGGYVIRLGHYPCDWDGCRKVFDRPQGLAAHKRSAAEHAERRSELFADSST